MRKFSCILKLLKISKSTYKIVVVKKVYYQTLGSYRPNKRSFDLEFVFLDSDKLLFWLGNGISCHISAYKFLNIFMFIKFFSNENFFKLYPYD
jgi:ribosomal protein S16